MSTDWRKSRFRKERNMILLNDLDYSYTYTVHIYNVKEEIVIDEIWWELKLNKIYSHSITNPSSLLSSSENSPIPHFMA